MLSVSHIVPASTGFVRASYGREDSANAPTIISQNMRQYGAGAPRYIDSLMNAPRRFACVLSGVALSRTLRGVECVRERGGCRAYVFIAKTFAFKLLY